jgi:integrase
MATYNYYLSKSESKEKPIRLYIRWKKNTLRYNINEVVDKKYWQNDSTKKNYQRALKGYNGYFELNSSLDVYIESAKRVFRLLKIENGNTEPTLIELKKSLDKEFNKGVQKGKPTLLSHYQTYIDIARTKYSIKTVQWYENSLKVLKEFQKEFGSIDFDNIDMVFYDDYIDFLTFDKGYRLNTIGKHIQNLKAVLTSATERGYNTNLNYKSKSFKKPSEESTQIHLTSKEVEDMYKIDLSNNKRLERVRDLFIVGCYTGLRFGDLSKIRKENIRGNLINLDVNKTGQKGLIIPIHPTVKEIMNKYKDNENSLPPTISGDKTRAYLKEIGQMLPSLNDYVLLSYKQLGKNKTTKEKKYNLIGTHTARRSFSTNMYEDENGIDMITIMAITGHKTPKQFLSYIKTSPREYALKFNKVWEKEHSLKAV